LTFFVFLDVRKNQVTKYSQGKSWKQGQVIYARFRDENVPINDSIPTNSRFMKEIESYPWERSLEWTASLYSYPLKSLLHSSLLLLDYLKANIKIVFLNLYCLTNYHAGKMLLTCELLILKTKNFMYIIRTVKILSDAV